jgi:cytochrome P450
MHSPGDNVIPDGVTLAADLGFTPWDIGFVSNPYDAYRRMRNEAPVAFNGETGQFVITRYDDVNSLLRDKRLGRTYLHVASHEEFGRPADPEMQQPFWDLVRNGMLDREPPDHTRLRRLVSKTFTPRMIEGLRPRMEALATQLVEQLLDATANGGVADLKAIVAEPLPVAVIADMLGVPEEDRHHLRPWSADIVGMYELNPGDETAQRAVRACIEFTDYLVGLARERKRNPKDDLITALANVVDEGETLTEGELVGTCALLLNAGHEATVNTTVTGWNALFNNPDQLHRIKDDHALIPSAVEELMRFDTPLQMFERWVLEDIEVQGVPIPRGYEVALIYGSANRDERQFADPDTLDVGRSHNPHITFGAGIHFCLGAPLARLELQTSFRTLLERIPTIKAVQPASWAPGYITRGLSELPVTR